MKRLKYLPILFTFLFIFSSLQTSLLAERSLEIIFLNVGYGDAIVIAGPEGEAILIDSGSKGNEKKILEFLKKRRIQTLDAIVITHYHENHYAAFEFLFDEVVVNHIYSNGSLDDNPAFGALQKAILKKNIPRSILRRGDKPVLLGGVETTVLNPEILSTNENANSLAIHLTYRGFSFLSTSDITTEIQKRFVDLYPESVKSHVVQIPHHGSPLNEDFKEAISKNYLILSTASNPYFLPLENDGNLVGNKLFRTDINGNITIRTDGRKISINSEVNI